MENFLVGVDEKGALYGVTYQPKGSKFLLVLAMMNQEKRKN